MGLNKNYDKQRKEMRQRAVNDASFLVGKTIKRVRYMEDSEAKDMLWYKLPIVIEFTDGTLLYPSADDEGNDGGAMFWQDYKNSGVIYTI